MHQHNSSRFCFEDICAIRGFCAAPGDMRFQTPVAAKEILEGSFEKQRNTPESHRTSVCLAEKPVIVLLVLALPTGRLA